MKKIWMFVLLSLVVSCKSNDGKQGSVTESKGAYKHVVILGVDGGGAFFSQAETPCVDEIFKNAATTYRAKTSYPTISAQCWGSMLLGVLPEFHRLTNEIISNRPYNTESPFPSIFRIAREKWPNAALASFCNWNPINYGIIENNLGVVEGTGNDPEVAQKVIDYLDGNIPTILFVQFDSVDGAGHANGYGTEGHLAALTAVDDLIGKIHSKLEAKGLLDETLFIVTADHGGTPQGSHGGDTEAERYVFLGVKGKTVCQNSQIEDVEVQDIPAIAAYALGLDIPRTWTGRVPGGLFPGVVARERVVMEIPVSENRNHKTTKTPSIDKVKTLLKDHNVVAYLPLDEDEKDAFGNVETVKNGKLYSYDAYFGKGTAFDDGYITLKDVAFGKGSFSVALWMKTNGVSGGGDPAIFSNKDWVSGGNDGFVFSLRENDIKFNAGLKSAGERMDVAASLPLDYNKGWMHVILVVDRKENKIRLYEDFSLENEKAIPESLANASFDALSLNIGQDGTGKYEHHLAAQLDEIIITSDVMDNDFIAALKEHYK